MWGQTVTLILLMLLKGHQGQECVNHTDPVAGLSGLPLQLWPSSMQMKAYSVEWKFWLPSEQAFKMILNWKTNKNVTYQQFALEYFNSSLGFKIENLSLLIEAAKPQHSSVYRLEVTDENGIVGCTQFKVFVFDHVEKPQLQGRWKALADRKCHLALSCLGVRGGNVSYTWYRGNELIPTPRNLSFLEVEADVNETHTYTCNVSNPVSWETQNFNLPQGCLSDSSESRLLLFWVIAMILVTLFLGTFAYFCVQKKKQQQSQTNLSGLQIMYEDVRQTRRYQELNTPGEGSTVYSVVQFQAPTSQEPDHTLYSLIQPLRETKSKKANCGPSSSCTIYEEIGKRPLKAHNPA